MTTLLQVALGGAIGSVLRWGAGLWVMRITGPGFPLGIITVNVLGSLLMGLAAVWLGRHAAWATPLVMTGILGGFTTFSAFSLEAVTLMERGQAGQALAYVGLSVGASLGALYLGIVLARGMLS